MRALRRIRPFTGTRHARWCPTRRKKWSRRESNPRPLECHQCEGDRHLTSPALNYRDDDGSTGRAYGACRPVSAALRGENVVRLAVSCAIASGTLADTPGPDAQRSPSTSERSYSSARQRRRSAPRSIDDGKALSTSRSPRSACGRRVPLLFVAALGCDRHRADTRHVVVLHRRAHDRFRGELRRPRPRGPRQRDHPQSVHVLRCRPDSNGNGGRIVGRRGGYTRTTGAPTPIPGDCC